LTKSRISLSSLLMRFSISFTGIASVCGGYGICRSTAFLFFLYS
jgi:hypothetical protein